MKKVSIIVPAFKVEPYIGACLDSLLDQGLHPDEYEIIVINDGSPDRSKDIADAYALKHPQIKVLDQENQGVSVARNRGLDAAIGTYVAFVDPDDSLHPGSLSKILEVAVRDDLDVLYLSLESYDEDGTYLETKESCGTDGVIADGFTHPRRTFLATLYKRSAIDDIRFIRGITRGQDTVFNVMVQACAQRCSYCSQPYYKYLRRSDSSRQFVGTERNFASLLLAIDSVDQFRLTHFPDASRAQQQYFDDAVAIFVRRALEWNILPQAHKVNFKRLKNKLRELGLQRVIDQVSTAFPFFSSSFSVFYASFRLRGYSDAIRYKLGRS